MERLLPLLIAALVVGCAPLADPPSIDAEGDPRFQLFYDNEVQVDLDVHVVDPDGEEISWENGSSASGGVLERDCKCSSCPDGPVEDVVWTEAAPSGTYTAWVAFYAVCEPYNDAGANFLLRVARAGEVVESWTGALYEGESERWTVDLP
jgi:hypothetical protein